jgi:DNA-binding transcriptional ArsR family regulator
MIDTATNPPDAVRVVEAIDGAAALLHPLRLRILTELAEPDSASGLARRLGIPRQQLNYHVRQLEDEGLVELVAERQRRGCTERIVRAVAKSYVIGPAPLGDLAADRVAMGDRASSGYLVATAARTIREVAALRERAAVEGKRLATLTLDGDVRFATPAAQAAFAQELSDSIARLIAKYHDADAPGGRTFRLTAGAWPAPNGDTEER